VKWTLTEDPFGQPILVSEPMRFKWTDDDRLDWVAMLEELTEPDSEETPPT